jgi:hypothetical protein
MRAIAVATLIAILGGAPAWAGIGGPIPNNACMPDMDKFKVNLGVLDVNGDGSFGAGMCANIVLAETVITCTSKEKLGKTLDIAIEYFDLSGAMLTASPPVVGNNLFCGIAAGETVTFHTVPPGSDLPTPWGAGGTPGYIPTSAAPVPIAPCEYSTAGCFLHGSARILATSSKVQCSATHVGLSNVLCGGVVPGSSAVKNLTILKKAVQVGD